MKKILIAYTTNSGSTEEVAQAIAEELGKAGMQPEVWRLEQVANLETYDGVILGAPMILGWHRAAFNFIKRHQGALSQIPVAYFLTAMSLTNTGEEQVIGVPVVVDPDLPKPPTNPARLGFKERYATVTNYVGKPLKAAPGVKPVSVAIFGGKLELFRLKLLQMLFVMLVIQAQPGDRRNWPFIRQWAAQVSSRF